MVDESAGNGKSSNRLWLGSIAFGTLVGGAVGWLTTRPAPKLASELPHFLPSVGVISTTETGPVLGVGLQGAW
jgi:hypothetical protein